jgi:hypothetical protein
MSKTGTYSSELLYSTHSMEGRLPILHHKYENWLEMTKNEKGTNSLWYIINYNLGPVL